MEAIYGVLGLIMIYSWIHSVVVLCKRTKGLTDYERILVWVGFGLITLYVIGTLS